MFLTASSTKKIGWILSIISKKRIVHALLFVFAIVLLYVVFGLVLNYNPDVSIFFGLSFALLFFTLAQSLYEIGLKNTLVFGLITVATGFGFEVLGTGVGVPFGKYYYTDFLGEKFLNVPIVVPLIWFVITYIAFSQSVPYFKGKLGNESYVKILGIASLVAFGALAWDLLVDPMFSSYGYWVWENNGSTLTLSGVPVSNFVGWLFVVFLMVTIFVLVTRGSKAIKRENTLDSRIAYILLFIDAAVANYGLGHYSVIVIGAVAMLSFVLTSYLIVRRGKLALKEATIEKPLGEASA